MKTNVVIVGGGVIGSSIAYHLAANEERSVVVVEPDPSYKRASSALSASAIRQQFVTPTCIRMSQYGFEFLRNISEHLGTDDLPVDLSLVEQGYLYLADASRADALERAIERQQSHEVPVVRLDKTALTERCPWLRSDDLVLGALGTACEGWFDGYGLLQAFRRKARHLGVTYLQDSVVDVLRRPGAVCGVRTAQGLTIDAGVVVNAAGPLAAAVASWAGFELPVQPERRCIFAFTCPERLDFMPLVVDPSGLYFRPEGHKFIAGGPATPVAGPDPLSLEVDYEQFTDFIWPALAHRVPAFESIRMTSAWAGHYEVNLLDHNAVIGWAPGIRGLMLANGFSGHGLQHAPATGRGVAELILHGRYQTLDLSELSPMRLVLNQPIIEHNVI
jgi:glycine/D-amino acid oxidase-like deaminating enzyme